MKLRDQAQGAELGVPSLKTLEARVKFHSKNLQPDRPQFLGGKQERKEFQEGTHPSEHWGGARERGAAHLFEICSLEGWRMYLPRLSF